VDVRVGERKWMCVWEKVDASLGIGDAPKALAKRCVCGCACVCMHMYMTAFESC